MMVFTDRVWISCTFWPITTSRDPEGELVSATSQPLGEGAAPILAAVLPRFQGHHKYLLLSVEQWEQLVRRWVTDTLLLLPSLPSSSLAGFLFLPADC